MSAGDCEARGLPAIVEDLMLRYRDKWLRFVQRMVQNRSDAEDVLQEAVLRMLTRDRSFRSTEQARMYLGRIICNTAIELYHMRLRYRRRYRPLNEYLAVASDSERTACPVAEQEELQPSAQVLNLLREGLSRLPAKQYEALRLTIMDSRVVSIRDAGVEHAIPYSTRHE